MAIYFTIKGVHSLGQNAFVGPREDFRDWNFRICQPHKMLAFELWANAQLESIWTVENPGYMGGVAEVMRDMLGSYLAKVEKDRQQIAKNRQEMQNSRR